MPNTNATTNNATNNFSWWDWLMDWISQAGWLEQGQWCQELGGILLNGTASGGPLDQFERETGRSFPELQAKRQRMVDTWLAWRDNEWWQIWETPELSGAYKAACQDFATALDAARAGYIAGIPGFLEWVKKNWKVLTVAAVIGTLGITGAVIATKGLSREK